MKPFVHYPSGIKSSTINRYMKHSNAINTITQYSNIPVDAFLVKLQELPEMEHLHHGNMKK